MPHQKNEVGPHDRELLRRRKRVRDAVVDDRRPPAGGRWTRSTASSRVRTNGRTGELLVARMFHVTDALWVASARVRAVASVAELQAVDEVERVIGEWEIGTPTPKTSDPAIAHLRKLLRAAGVSAVGVDAS